MFLFLFAIYITPPARLPLVSRIWKKADRATLVICVCSFCINWKRLNHRCSEKRQISYLTMVYSTKHKYLLKRVGLPLWLSGKESACQCRRHRFYPWSRKILLSVEQLSPCTTTAEPVLQSLGAATAEPNALETVLHKRNHHHEKPAHHNQTKAPTAIKTWHSQKEIE